MPLFIPGDDEAKRYWEPGVSCDTRHFPERQLSRTAFSYTGRTSKKNGGYDGENISHAVQ